MKRKSMKPILSGILAMAMVLGMTACGGSDAGTTAAPNGTAAPAGATAAEGTEAAGGAVGSGFGEGLVYLNQVQEMDTAAIESAKKDLVVAQSKDPGSMLPYNVSPSIYATSGWMVCERLAAFDENLDVVPVLVEGYEYSEDGLTLKFTLKKGVKYSTGEEMVAADVLGVIQNYVANSSLASGQKDLFDYTAVTAEDDYTISMKLNYQCSFAHEILTKICAIPLSYQQEKGDSIGIDGIIGTGAYMLDEYKEGEYIRLAANPNYWDAEHMPKLDSITFQFISESSVALIELQNGNVDFIFDPSGVEYNDVAAGGYENLLAVECPSLACQSIFFNATGVLSDVRLRQAICYALDTESINLSVFEGVGGAGTSLVPTGLWAYDEKMADYYNYDPEKAKSLLAEAGYADGLTVKMVCASTSAFKGISEMMLSQLAEVGITLQIEYADNATANSLTQDSSDFDIAIRQAGFTEEPHGGLAKYVMSTKGTNGGTNLSKTAGIPEAEAIDALMDQIISITDKGERKAAYAAVQEAYYDQAYGYAVHENVDIYCMASSLKGVVRTSGYLNFQYCYFD
ncbi:ABC transporter substrate-binding protein [Hominifimenecus sp. rT4P-3]|uniref:ABC transporter substrate-binding protein n=1 Tax=Hominifimenecus sp. rT4P-3 TaxID=3242979 RepID=UPI003DA59986